MDTKKCARIKATIAIERFLEDLGYGTGRKMGKEIVYHSMIRDGDSSPSFSVNPEKRKWYDRGDGRGGTIIDLAMLVFGTDSITEVIERIDRMYSGDLIPEINVKNPVPRKEPRQVHEITCIRQLGTDGRLTAYLASRGILDAAMASGFLREVYYDHIREDGTRKPFFGVGWQNISGGWDIRSRAGKTCLLKKDYFLKTGMSGTASIFEGMMNYLSALTENPDIDQDTVIVLNSLSISGRAIGFLKSRGDISRHELYLDHGPGGRGFTGQFLSELPGSEDRSYLYRGHGDYNDKIMAELQNRRRPLRSRNQWI